MKYLLDTNVCVQFLRGRNLLIRGRVLAVPTSDLVICSPVFAELSYGAVRSHSPTTERAKVEGFVAQLRTLPFDDAAASRYGDLRRDLERAGTPIGGMDMLIAAIALVHGLTLVTHNMAEFGRVTGLPLEDWETP